MNEKTMMIIKTDNLIEIIKCFSNGEECHDFIKYFCLLGQSALQQLGEMADAYAEDQAEKHLLIFAQEVSKITWFLKEHIELIHSLIKTLDCKTIDFSDLDD